MKIGELFIFVLPVFLSIYALSRRDGSMRQSLVRWVEQLFKIVPTMICALIAAGFLAAIIPDETISRFLGDGTPWLAILVGSVTGVMFPTGPVVAFSIAASFSIAGATDAALVSFITSWTLFALHRMFIYEIPLLGISFVQVRILSILTLPLIAGALVIFLNQIVRGFGGG